MSTSAQKHYKKKIDNLLRHEALKAGRCRIKGPNIPVGLLRHEALKAGRCWIKGPNIPVGDCDWECVVHKVVAIRINWDNPEPRRSDFVCPMGVEQFNA